MHQLGILFVLVSMGMSLGAAEPADTPLEGSNREPFESGGRRGLVSAAFQGGRLQITWELGALPGTNEGSPRVIASTDAPGHWAVRDWRAWPMTAVEGGWEARLPLLSASVPVVYFVEDAGSRETRQSSMRCFWPQRAGVLEPTLAFRGFLEGFEQGLVGWEWGGSGDGGAWMTVSTNAWAGRGALRLEVPTGRGSATVGTVRVRGWMLDEFQPKAISMAVRMESGEGRLRLALHGHARTEALAVYPALDPISVSAEWQRVEVPLKQFVHLRNALVDWMTLQLLADSGRAVLVDEVELVLR